MLCLIAKSYKEKCIGMFVWMTPGSVSPSKGRAHSTGPVHTARRSRVDTARKPITGESSSAATTTSQPSAPAQAAVAAPSTTSQRLSRVKSMPSKLNADQKSSNAATATAGAPPVPTSGRTPSAKRATKSAVSSQATTPTGAGAAAKPMPSAPKAMAPRAVPKEPKAMKDVTTNKPVVTSQKVLLSLSMFTA